MSEAGHAPLRVAFVPGVTPGKWARVWQERVRDVPLELAMVEESDQTAVLYDGRADMCFVRLPVERDGLDVIPLYHEVAVVVAPLDHVVGAVEEVTVADLADEHLLQDPDTVPEWREVAVEVRDGTRVDVPPLTMRQAVETVAAGTGIVIVPMSVARLHNRKDVLHRPVTDVAQTQVALAWPTGSLDERLETFIGVVRGRTARSTRGPATPGAAPDATTGKAGKTAKTGKAGKAPTPGARTSRAGAAAPRKRPSSSKGHGRGRPGRRGR